MSEHETKSTFNNSLSSVTLRLIALAVIDAFALWFIYGQFAVGGNGFYVALMVAFITLGVNVIFLSEKLYPLRWFSPGLALMFLLVVYPVIFTTYTAFTNYGTGNLLTKEQAIDQLEQRTFLPEEGGTFAWTAFRSEEGAYLLWMQSEDDAFLAAPGEVLTLEEVNAGPPDEEGIPTSIPGYERLARGQTLRFLSELDGIEFGNPENPIFVRSLDAAAQVQPKYVYDAEQDVLVDQETETVYEPIDGRFTAADGEQLTPGYFVPIGLRNFTRLFDPNNPAFRGPFLRIFLWTFAYAVLTVTTTFALGLFLAIIFNDPTLPGRKLIQSLMVVPYAVPAFISVQMWRGLMNPSFGVISEFIRSIFGQAPPWFADPIWAKVGIIFVGLWVGFPYMFLICSGALQSIPTDIYEAARVDGAGVWAQFRSLTLPLLLVAVGPLLIASFAFNFNNFTVIDVYNEGGPPIPNTPTPAGHTDILITYIFRLAFAGGRGVDYGYASAITIVIFIILALLVLFQFRYTRVWEEVSENV